MDFEAVLSVKEEPLEESLLEIDPDVVKVEVLEEPPEGDICVKNEDPLARSAFEWVDCGGGGRSAKEGEPTGSDPLGGGPRPVASSAEASALCGEPEKKSTTDRTIATGDGTNYVCSPCGCSSSEKSKLIVHIRLPAKEKPSLCPKCYFTSSQKSALTRHEGDESLSCSQCGYSTSREPTLVMHFKRKHSGENRFPCSQCDYSSKVDGKNQIDDKLKRKRELANARMKRYREKKSIESQRLKSLMVDDPNKEMRHKQVEENKAERKRELAKERARRFRERKRLLNVAKSVHDSQISGPSDGNPPLVLRNDRNAIHDSEIAGTPTKMSIPLDDSENLNRIGEHFLSLQSKGNQPVHVNDNLVPLEDEAIQKTC